MRPRVRIPFRYLRFSASALLAAMSVAVALADTPPPATVTIAGSLQSEAGCSGDWQPDCASTHLTYDAADTVWQGIFNLPAGNYEYKAALNNSWSENYGLRATRDGANIPLSLADAASVKFFYDHKTHWVTDNRSSVIAVAPGSFQSELGCPGDWQPDCLRSWLQDPDGDGIYSFTTRALPAGDYETKVAINESWSENYGAGGAQNGANIPFTVPSDCTPMRFDYDALTHVLTVTATSADAPQPTSVTIAGSLQSELGCSGDWQPDCATTHLDFDVNDQIWQKTFSVPAGNYEYKAPLNDSWDENYGLHAQRNGANIPLSLADAADVKFYYDNVSHWVTDNKNSIIATVPGSFQSELGCSGDWDPSCLRSWLQDPDGDGIYTFSAILPAGNYECKVAINESWNENYGAGGVQNGPNIAFSVPAACTTMFFSYDPTSHILTVSSAGGPRGNLRAAQAHWVTRDTLAWRANTDAGTTYKLHGAPLGGLKLETTGVTGGTDFSLTYDPAGLSDAVKAKFPHLSGFQAFKLGAGDLSQVPDLLKGQLAISATGADGTMLDATSIQIPGVLDDLYTYNGPLGATFAAGVPTLRVWAPTAKSVKLHLYDSSAAKSDTVSDMTGDPTTGVWSTTGTADWNRKFYQYEVEVYAPTTGQVERNLVTDPYSVSLSMNSRRTQIVNLSDADLKPKGWDKLKKPDLDAPEDIVLYELHVRDFSANDPTVPAELRGTFKAFALPASNGMRHLGALALAGLTHVHLLPAFDFATVNEDKSTWLEPAGDLASMAPNSDQQQAAVAAIRDQDGFNWGYDPWHYSVPEGSYATNADGPARIREFREMVQGLAGKNLRVVMDVVYNHTTASGQSDRSVLDRVVPGYYHRLNLDGGVERSSCCENTASEHAMMEKLIVDSTRLWATQYKVDGFRFDLMGHHMKSNILKVRDTLHGLTMKDDGVDGSKIYVYGEGWNFGEVANNARGVNAVQANMAGTGVGTFNDRLRDGARGGGPFSPVQDQGFIDGLFTDPNGTNQGSPDDQKNRLLMEADWIRVGLAGGLADYQFVDRTGNLVPASQIDYNGQHSGYTEDPQELINYVSAHDNDTLFDAVQFKAAPARSIQERIRMHELGISIIGLGQGIPFFHAGDELIRSKSLDRNSYNSGDWFNKLDFSYTSNNWGVGLPMAGDNQSNWPIDTVLLGNPALKPAPLDMRHALVHFMETVAIRKSSSLFRLRTASDIASNVRMYNVGPDQVPGLIVMALNAGDEGDRLTARRSGGSRSAQRTAGPSINLGWKPVRGVPDYDRVVVLFNGRGDEVTFSDASLAGLKLKLHPIQAGSTDTIERQSTYDNATGTFKVPGRSTAVFVCCGGPNAVTIRANF